MRLGFLGVCCVAISISLLPGNARADYYNYFRPEIYSVLGKKRDTGLKLGRGRLHLALGVLNTYDSNALFSSVDPRADYVLKVIPGADYIWASQRFTLLVGYRFTYRNNLYETVQDDKGHIANVDGRYKFTRRFSFGARNMFERTTDPADIQIYERLKRWRNEASGDIRYTTPGEDFDTTLRYTHVYQKYNGDLSALSFYQNKVSVTSRVNVSSRFRFLPKSVASATLEYGQTDFTNDPALVVRNNDSKGIFGKVGLTTQLTRKISLIAEVGGTGIFFDAGPNTSGIIGGAHGVYRPNSRASFKMGYQRRVQISTFTNYYSSHRFDFDANWKFARRFDYVVKAAFDFLDYSDPNINLNGIRRKDFVIQALTGVSYSITEWCKARVEYQLDRRDSNGTNPSTGLATASFTKHRANLGVDFYY